jgi:hypothetical protein
MIKQNECFLLEGILCGNSEFLVELVLNRPYPRQGDPALNC